MATKFKKNKRDIYVKPIYLRVELYMFVGVVLLLLSFLLYQLDKLLISLLLLIFGIIIFSILIIGIILNVIKCKSVRNYIDNMIITRNIIKNLIDTMSLNNMISTKYIEVPKIKVDLSNNKITIERLPNMNNVDELIINISNALSNKYVDYAVTDYVEDDNYMSYKFIIDDVNIDKTLLPQRIEDLLCTDLYEFIIQKKLKWNMNKVPHCIITGKSGSGKSTMLLSMLLQILGRDIDFIIIDPKYEFSAFSFIKDKIANDKFDVFVKLNEVLKLLENRQKLVQNKIKEVKKIGASAYDLGMKPFVLIFDELSSFVSSLDRNEKKMFDDALTQIIQKGRSCGIFMIVAMQNANSETIKVAIRNQFSLRILLGNSSQEDIRFMFNGNNVTVKKSVDKFTGYYYLDGVTNTPQKIFVPNLHRCQLNNVDVFEKCYNESILNKRNGDKK